MDLLQATVGMYGYEIAAEQLRHHGRGRPLLRAPVTPEPPLRTGDLMGHVEPFGHCRKLLGARSAAKCGPGDPFRKRRQQQERRLAGTGNPRAAARLVLPAPTAPVNLLE